ncbi:MAG: hypothetical protein ACM4AI_08985 [Acidobacteriota bacterium]
MFAAVAVSLACVGDAVAQGQPASPPIAPDQQYLIIDVVNTGTLQRELAAAGGQGFEIIASSNLCVLLKRTQSGPRTYQVVAATRDSTLVRELNQAGARGFQLARAGLMTWGDEWIAILEQRTEGVKFVYEAIKADDNVNRALDSARQRSARVVGVLGKRLNPNSFSAMSFKNPTPIVIVEQGGSPLSEEEVRERDYRAVSTTKTSTLEKEVIQAASEGFRIIGWGYMTVVLERTSGETRPADFRVIATTRLATAQQELRQAGEEGYRLVATPDAANETICVMQRMPGNSERYNYLVASLSEKEADERMRSALNDHYRLAALILGRIGVFEKPATR